MSTRMISNGFGWALPVVLVSMVLLATSAGADVDRRPAQHNLAIALPSPMQFTHTDHFAREIYYLGEATVHTVLKNTTGVVDTFNLNIANDIVPDGVGSFDWLGFYCDTSGSCHFGPWDYVLEPGEAETFDVHLTDNIGTVQGMALTTLTAAWGGESTSMSFATFVDLPSILLIDDDDGASNETYLVEALEDYGFPARVWDADAMGRPGLDLLASHRAVLWTTADGSATYIDSSDEANMVSFLDGGGNLMLASMDYLSSRSASNALTAGYLHITDWSDDTGAVTAEGVAGSQISDGLSLPLTGGPIPASNTDSMVLEEPAQALFTSSTDVVGLSVEHEGYRAVFLGFPIEDVPLGGPYPNNLPTMAGYIVEWLTAPRLVRGENVPRLSLQQNVPNPFNPRTEIAFTVPDGAGVVTLTVHNVDGQVVRSLVEESLPAGPATAVWDGRDESGHRVASGVYFASLTAAGESVQRKMLLLK